MSERRAPTLKRNPTPGEQLVFEAPEFLQEELERPVRPVVLMDDLVRRRTPLLARGDIHFNRGSGHIYIPQWGPQIDDDDSRLTDGKFILLPSNRPDAALRLLIFPDDEDIEASIRRMVHVQGETGKDGERRQNTTELVNVFRDMVVALHAPYPLREVTRSRVMERTYAILAGKGYIRPISQHKKSAIRELEQLKREGVYLDREGRYNPSAMELKWVARWRKLLYELVVMNLTHQKFSYLEFVLRDERNFERTELERLARFVAEVERTKTADKEFVRKTQDLEEFALALIEDEDVKVQPYIAPLALFASFTFGLQGKYQRAKINTIVGQSAERRTALKALEEYNTELDALRQESEREKDKSKREEILKNRGVIIKTRAPEYIRLVQQALILGEENLPQEIKPSTKRKPPKRRTRKRY